MFACLVWAPAWFLFCWNKHKRKRKRETYVTGMTSQEASRLSILQLVSIHLTQLVLFVNLTVWSSYCGRQKTEYFRVTLGFNILLCQYGLVYCKSSCGVSLYLTWVSNCLFCQRPIASTTLHCYCKCTVFSIKHHFRVGQKPPDRTIVFPMRKYNCTVYIEVMINGRPPCAWVCLTFLLVKVFVCVFLFIVCRWDFDVNYHVVIAFTTIKGLFTRERSVQSSVYIVDLCSDDTTMLWRNTLSHGATKNIPER